MRSARTRELLDAAARSFFKLSEVSILLDKPIQTLHSWLKTGKIREYDRSSETGPYQIPRAEVSRLLRLAGREVPGLWEKRRARVLFIDDDPLLRTLALDAATYPAFPMQLRAAATIEDGLLLAPGLNPEVILIDVSFPGDLLQAELGLAFIRHAQLTRRARVIAMVDYARQGKRMLRAGADAVLQKPFGLGELRTAIYVQWKHEERKGTPAAYLGTET